MDINIESNYNRFKQYIMAYVKRPGTEEFLKWLDTTDFSTAPESTKFHMCEPGGLCQHSLNVFMRLIRLVQSEYGKECPFSKDTIALVSLLHDISKVGKYKPYYKNVKNEETGQWEKELGYMLYEDTDKFVFGSHQEDSVYIIRQFFTISREEEMAIIHHHGGFDADDREHKSLVSLAFDRSKFAFLMHIADMMATHIDEVELGEYVERYPFNVSGKPVVDGSETVPVEPSVTTPTVTDATVGQCGNFSSEVNHNVEQNIAGTTSAVDDCPF